jgi:hypothetical protein
MDRSAPRPEAEQRDRVEAGRWISWSRQPSRRVWRDRSTSEPSQQWDRESGAGLCEMVPYPAEPETGRQLT